MKTFPSKNAHCIQYYSLADFCEDGELIRATLRPLKDIARLVADKTNSRPALQIVVLGHKSSSGIPTTGTSVRNSSGADLCVCDHAVLDPDWPDVHLADLW